MSNKIRMTCRYVDGWQSASDNWEREVIPAQEAGFPKIRGMHPGTLNLRLIDPEEYVPSDIPIQRAEKNQSCISRTAKVVSINDHPLEAFIYNGGWPANTLELLSTIEIAITFGLSVGDLVEIEVIES